MKLQQSRNIIAFRCCIYVPFCKPNEADDDDDDNDYDTPVMKLSILLSHHIDDATLYTTKLEIREKYKKGTCRNDDDELCI